VTLAGGGYIDGFYSGQNREVFAGLAESRISMGFVGCTKGIVILRCIKRGGPDQRPYFCSSAKKMVLVDVRDNQNQFVY
jgi:hypothetical protein